MLRFLAGRATAGVDCVCGDAYLRTVILGESRGWVKASPVAGRNLLAVEVSTSLAAVLPALLFRLRCLFDLDARPEVIAAQLGGDPRMAATISQVPGLRVPGCVDGFELAVRAILGQRISVVAASTLAGRLAATFGEPIETPYPLLSRLSPRPQRLAERRGSSNLLHSASPLPAPGPSASWPRPCPWADRARAIRRSRARDRPAQGAAGHRRLDRALHRHARPPLARRVPGRRPGFAAGRGCKVPE